MENGDHGGDGDPGPTPWLARDTGGDGALGADLDDDGDVIGHGADP